MSLPNGKTRLVNNCGHEFDYTIRKPGAVLWLQGRPCPSCAGSKNKGTTTKTTKKLQDIVDENERPVTETEAEGIREADITYTVDTEAVQKQLDLLPNTPFHKVLPDVITIVQAGLPLWLQGPPGTSKSTLVEQTATALGLGFYPLSCHEMMTRSDLFGYVDAVGQEHRTPLWDAFENGGICLLDEVDNGNPNLLAALNSALSNGHCVFGSGTIVNKHPDFRVVATANTAGLGPEHGYIGRNGVDLATRDRFVTVAVPIDHALEDVLAALFTNDEESVVAGVRLMNIEATKLLEIRNVNKQNAPNVKTVLKAVRNVRAAVESRYRGTVVSPRTTIHSSVLTVNGFTLREALSSKLVGLDADSVNSLLNGASL